MWEIKISYENGKIKTYVGSILRVMAIGFLIYLIFYYLKNGELPFKNIYKYLRNIINQVL